MTKYFFLGSTLLMITISCKSSDSNMLTNNATEINLDANNRENTEIKSIYNSIVKNDAILLINKKKIPNEQVQAVLDTLTVDNYTMNVNKNEGIIELISK